VLGAGTVVASPAEAAAGYHRQGGRDSQPGRPASPPAEWQGAWQEDDGWDLSDDALLGTDEEDAGKAGAGAGAAQARGAGEATARAQQQPKQPTQQQRAQPDSDSDWDS
jgi:hypothetical protein